MTSKATFLVGAAVGYVLGARAGRERYETIKRAARGVASNPMVQQATSSIGQQASEIAVTATRVVSDRVGERLPFAAHRGGPEYGTPNGRQTL